LDLELTAEQSHLDQAYACLEWMRARAEEVLEGTDPKELDLVHALRRRVRALTDGGRPLCFGRIDLADGERFHIGRRHVEDGRGEPVVVEWRAPVAVPFYRGSAADPHGLTRRRQFLIDGRSIHSMAEEMFGAGAGTPPRIRGGDALLAELERSRAGEMLDIVSTIQAEQDEVIRAPLPGLLVVQGGPGSGKTAVGLHRAAFLLYDEEDLARQGVLVLGPNRVFLRYIAQVLPSLGEEAVVQTTVRDLGAARVVAVDDPQTERIKGDVRMATVLARALAGARRPLDADVEVAVGLRRLVLPAAAAGGLAADVAGRRLPYDAGRGVLRDALVAALVGLHPEAQTEGYARVEREVRASRPLAAALDQLWPAVSAAALVRTLLTSRAALRRAASGLLSVSEQDAVRRPATPTEPLEVRTSALPPPAWELRRPSTRHRAAAKRREPWTVADVALLDEAAWLVTGDVRTYGHVVVDEAQDLSPMQLRMVARRAPGGSVTVLGDLAQASGVWAPESWDDVAAHLNTPDDWRVAELRLGYRAPADVVDLASRLLPEAAPAVTRTEAVRTRRGGVRFVAAGDREPGGLEAAAAEAARALEAGFGSVAVIVPAARIERSAAALVGAGVDAGRAEDGLDRRVTVVEATQAKGLEFDAVVVVDPAGIVSQGFDRQRGLRLLYVALTRPTQALTVVHAGDLPPALSPHEKDASPDDQDALHR
jgi:DNA helicase IV